MKTYDVTVAGVKYELPTTMAVMNSVETDSLSNNKDLFLENSISGYLIQGLIVAGLRALGVSEIGGEALTYDAVGRVCSFSEAVTNRLALLAAITPDEPADGVDEKNVTAG